MANKPNVHMRPVVHSPKTAAAIKAFDTIWPAVESGLPTDTPNFLKPTNCPAVPTAQNKPDTNPTIQIRGLKAKSAPAWGTTNSPNVNIPNTNAPNVIPNVPCAAVPPILVVTRPVDPHANAGIRAIKIDIFKFPSQSKYFLFTYQRDLS